MRIQEASSRVTSSGSSQAFDRAQLLTTTLDQLTPCQSGTLASARRLMQIVEPRQSDKALKKTCRALVLGFHAHSGQKRADGNDFFSHPIEVATMLASAEADSVSIQSALLHDTLEDTALDESTIETEISEKVLRIVEALTKLRAGAAPVPHKRELALMRMFRATASDDLRVAVVKLADRTHNMTTLAALPRKARQRIAQETWRIFGPLAQRLGITEFYELLLDCSLRELHPRRYQVIKDVREQFLGIMRDSIADLTTRLSDAIPSDVNAEVSLVEPSTAYWYRRIRLEQTRSRLELRRCYLRVVLNTNDKLECYRALGSVHSVLTPISQYMRDYVRQPSHNNRSGLYTTCAHYEGKFWPRVEIVTKAMELENQIGVIHKLGKEEYDGFSESLQQHGTDHAPLEFMQKIERFLQLPSVRVYCSADGNAKTQEITLPHSSTVLDLLFAFEAERAPFVGSVDVDGYTGKLDQQLKANNIVRFTFGEERQLTAEWSKYTSTQSTQEAIRTDLESRNTQRLQQMCDMWQGLFRELAKAKKLSGAKLEDVFKKLFNQDSAAVASALASSSMFPEQTLKEIAGAIGLVRPPPLHLTSEFDEFLSCCEHCRPLPGDTVYLASSSNGITIHRPRCRQLQKTNNRYRCSWEKGFIPKRLESTQLRIWMKDRPGVLAKLMVAMSEGVRTSDSSELNFTDIKVNNRYERETSVDIFAMISDTRELRRLLDSTRKLNMVVEVSRVTDTSVHTLKRDSA